MTAERPADDADEAAIASTSEPESAVDTASEAAAPDAGRSAEVDQGAILDEDAFALELPVFQGPLDLLLHLIEREELDVTEVSLLAVTEQYLAHLRSAEQLQLGALAEFIAVGARLLLLKSRALLPREPGEESDADDDGDPAALVAALEEYRRFRLAADHLRGLEEDRHASFRREAAPPEVPPSSGLDGVGLDSLVAIFREVLERLPPDEEPEPATIARHEVRLADRVDRLTTLLDRDQRISFRTLIGGAASRMVVIVDFLAVLELLKVRYLEARQEEAFGEIELIRRAGAEAPRGDALAELALADEAGGSDPE